MTVTTLTETTDKKTVIREDNGFITDVYSIQKVDKLLKDNRDLRNMERPKMLGNTQRHVQHVAEIPENLYYDLCHKHGTPQENPQFWKKWLNDKDNFAFRTSEVTV